MTSKVEKEKLINDSNNLKKLSKQNKKDYKMYVKDELYRKLIKSIAHPDKYYTIIKNISFNQIGIVQEIILKELKKLHFYYCFKTDPYVFKNKYYTRLKIYNSLTYIPRIKKKFMNKLKKAMERERGIIIMKKTNYQSKAQCYANNMNRIFSNYNYQFIVKPIYKTDSNGYDYVSHYNVELSIF